MSAVHLFDSVNIDPPPIRANNYNTAITLLVMGLLVIMAGVFLVLAAYRILPAYANSISQIGRGAWSIGALSIATGIGMVSLSIVLFKNKSIYSSATHAQPLDSIKTSSVMNSKDTEWLGPNDEGYRYMQFLATQFSGIYVPEKWAILEGKWPHPDSVTPHRIDQIEKYIFELLPLDPLYNTKKNLPIALDVSGIHLTLIYIDREKRTVEYYDGKKNYGEYDEIVKQLTHIAARLSQEDPLLPPYQFIPKIQIVLQPDSYQCVVWFAYFLENRLKHPEIDFNTLDVSAMQLVIRRFRRHILTTLENIDELETVAYAKETIAYFEVYQDREIAAKKIEEDRDKLGFGEYRKLALSGKSLKPI